MAKLRYNKSIAAKYGTKAMRFLKLYHDWRIKMEKTNKAKVVNYTDEQTATAKEMYAKGASIDSIAQAIGKGTKSVIAKLVREGVYKKAEKAEAGKARTTKAETAVAIGNVLGLNENDVESLTGATKNALQKIFGALAMSKPI